MVLRPVDDLVLSFPEPLEYHSIGTWNDYSPREKYYAARKWLGKSCPCFSTPTFAVEPYLALPLQYHRHPLADVVEVQDAEKLVRLLLQGKGGKMRGVGRRRKKKELQG